MGLNLGAATSNIQKALICQAGGGCVAEGGTAKRMGGESHFCDWNIAKGAHTAGRSGLGRQQGSSLLTAPRTVGQVVEANIVRNRETKEPRGVAFAWMKTRAQVFTFT